MKQLVRSIICVLFMAFILQMAGCSNQLPSDTSRHVEKAPELYIPPTISWESEEPEETYEDEKEEQDEEEEEEEYEVIDYFPNRPTIEETVMYDQNQVRITAKEITYTSSSAEISLLIENNSNGQITVLSDTMDRNSINGYMLAYGYINEDINVGDSREVEITVYGSDLLFYGITDIADFELGFIIRDQNNNEIDVDPCRVRTSLADTYDYSSISVINHLSDPKVQKSMGYSTISINNANIYDCVGLSVVQDGVFKTKNEEFVITLEVKNSGDSIKYLVLRNLVIDGLTVQNGFCTQQGLNPGAMGNLSLNLSRILDESKFKLAGLGSFSKVSFDLVAEDIDYNILADPAKITLTFPGEDLVSLGTKLYEGTFFRVYQLGILPDDSKYSDDYHIILVYENLTDESIEIKLPYKGFLINGSTEATISARTVNLSAKEKELVDIKVYDYSFENVGILNWSDVSSVSIILQANIADERVVLEEATIVLNPAETDLP